MQHSGTSSDENIAIRSNLSRKRKNHDRKPQDKVSSKPSSTSTESLFTPSPTINATTTSRPTDRRYPSPPATKRLKTIHPSNLGQSADMSKVMSRPAQPKVIDLTGSPSNFQPHVGVKKLVIKNLRPSSRKDIDSYYERTWSELDGAITAVFNGSQPAPPLEVLCRGVEATCRRGQAEKLANYLRDRCKAYIEKQLLPTIESQARPTNIDALRTIYRFWTVWNDQSTLLRSIFSYLDRSYLLSKKDALQLEDQGIHQFRHAIFTKAKIIVDGHSLGGRVVLGVCDLVDCDRIGQEDLFDANLLKDSVLMLHVFGIFGKSFEPRFLDSSKTYFESFVQEHSNSSMKDYISACDRLLVREAHRCDKYNFDSTTKRSLLNSAHRILIEECSDVLLDPTGFAKLVDTDDIGSLKSLYSLLSLSNIQHKLKKPFEAHIRHVGASVVSDNEKVDQMVVRLLEFKRTLDVIIRDAFARDETFSYGLREAFGHFINDKTNTLAWGTNNSKVGEMIAKYIDMLLRGGLKAVPRSLASDANDRDYAEKQGQASAGDEDAELDRQLEQALELFRFIEGKDVFEAFYKKDLARRLLMARSASQDAERNMLAKLKSECGFSFTHNLEQMFKDQELARDEMIAYKQSVSNAGKPTLDLQVSVLSAAAWPTYPDVKVNLPSEVAKHIEKYDLHYRNKHTGRRLTWKHALAHSVVKARFGTQTKELLVSAFQAIVLVLFNDIGPGEHLSYIDIQSATGLIDAELQRTLQSLACAKFRILTKHPKGREVDPTNTFTLNTKFTDPKYRIKINQIQLKETNEENKETHEKIHQDRQYETQAAIVRIMKSRRTMTHPNLVAEVIAQTKARGAVEPNEIKKNIEKLIEKDYIEREDSKYLYIA
ncbi:Cullin homology [Venustampulla echinocandica]|uniref:Cullin homology n=1 Tax=Venustampulla echinocandica TaxID=2656787 RepID=A0A370TW60_9HELO|nr:Cullin homology [Venustampulla echinocandica]RDL39757.1 Cullin homology [Venustampulla echinocandica]